MTTTVCEAETCETCGAGCIDTDQNGECRSCAGADSLLHNLRLMAAGVTRDKATGRYIKIGDKK
jgi:hypothetical protein